MSSKARDLRRRMSIDPDAPEPVARPARVPPTPGARPPGPDEAEPPPEVQEVEPERPAVVAAPEPEWTTALDDPAIRPGQHGYRSFYVDDTVFARFRSAIYWTARRPDARGVPDNMSVGVEAYMEELASDLERRYNEGAVFAPTPDQIRAQRRRDRGR